MSTQLQDNLKASALSPGLQSRSLKVRVNESNRCMHSEQ